MTCFTRGELQWFHPQKHKTYCEIYKATTLLTAHRLKLTTSATGYVHFVDGETCTVLIVINNKLENKKPQKATLMTGWDDVTRRGTHWQWDDAVTVMVRHGTHITQSEDTSITCHILHDVCITAWYIYLTLCVHCHTWL